MLEGVDVGGKELSFLTREGEERKEWKGAEGVERNGGSGEERREK